MRKALADEHGQQVMALAHDLAGAGACWRVRARCGRPTGGEAPSGSGPGRSPLWDYGYLFAPALTIGGGTWEVQRNIIAERTLGLHDPARAEPRAARGSRWGRRRRSPGARPGRPGG